MKKIFTILSCAVLLSAAISSCKKEQTELFDTAAAARMQEALTTARTVLTSAANGWMMEYFVGNSKDKGGYSLVLSFTDEKVTATSERDLSLTTETYYKLTTDNGPVLTFDTYSPVLHEFATPSGSSNRYQGLGGDFEFLIMEATPEKVILKGKRSGKISALYPLAEDGMGYLSSIKESSESFVAGTITGTVNGKKVEAEVDLDYRQIAFYEVTEDGEAIDEGAYSPFIFTKTGIKFYEPIEVAGGKMTYLDYNADTHAVTNSEVTADLHGVVPEDFLPFRFFEGDYVFKTYFGNYDVTLTKGEGKTYIMSGLSEHFDLTMEYISAKGRLSLKSQKVGTYQGMDVIMCPWDLTHGGSFYTIEGLGLELVWNLDEEHPVFTFESDGLMTGFSTDAFILAYSNNGKNAGGAKDCPWFVWDSYQWPYIIRKGVSNTMTKK